MSLIRSVWLVLALAACSPSPRTYVDAADYDAFWLWAGVTSRPALKRAKTLYLLAGEVRRDTGKFISLKPGIPHLAGPELWLVVRVDTLDWQPETTDRIIGEVTKWRAAKNRLIGVQIDFDARTRHLERYAAFLRAFRTRLPAGTRLSVTGLLDWSANGDPKALQGLYGSVDEIVIQTYQGRHTIPGYAAYFGGISRLTVPFRIGLVEGGEWTEPPGLYEQRAFRGYVVFLVDRPRR